MFIKKTPQGWQIIPISAEEEEHLHFLIEALREKYGKPIPSAAQATD